MLKDILDSDFRRLFAITVIVLGIQSPGMLGIAMFFPDWFASVDFLKVLSLSLAFVAPFYVANMMLVSQLMDTTEAAKAMKKDIEHWGVAATAAIPTSAILYLPLLVKLLWTDFAIRMAVIFALIAQVIFALKVASKKK